MKIAAATIAASLLGGAAMAGTEVLPPSCEASCYQALYAYMPTYMASHAPVLAAPAERFEVAASGATTACPARTGTGPSVFGVMLGPTEIEGLTRLQGPPNDIQLMTQVMADRGIAQEFISISQGDAADRKGMLAAMAKPLACLRENDQVVLIYTGWGTVYPQEWFDYNGFAEAFCAAPAAGEAQRICSELQAPEPRADYLASVSEGIGWASRQWLYMSQPTTAFAPGNRLHVLIGSGSKASSSGTLQHLAGVSAADVSNFVTRIRNRGADAFLVIDTRLAASGELYALQTQAAAAPAWAASGSAMLEYNGFPPIQDEASEREPVALFGTGDYAVLYAANVDSEAYEYPQGADGKPLGALIFRVAEALRKNSSIRFREMALVIARSFGEANSKRPEAQKQDPLFQASNPDLAFLAPRAVPLQKTDGGIEIISPSPKRGAAAIEEEVLSVVARYTGGARAQMAIIDGNLVPVDANGQFRGDVSDAGSKFAVALRVLGANYETLATGELRLRDKPAEPVIASPARKIALVIANQNYADPAFQPLRTPFADAEAVASVLRERFGFLTRLDTGDAPLDLFLKDATKAQIEQALFQLRRRLTAEDQLLIYYAGHGENDPDLGAFWVPADGEAGADFTWVEAHEITTALKRMNAASVLVISDSCYAGGLSRGSSGEGPGAEARERYLAKASRLKSRQLMASGGEEPVEDGGGGAHSVFAKALIEALQSMPDRTFTASELFEQKVKPAVISAANALTEGQTPGFSRIARAGDEPGSEFVFQAVAATSP